MKISTMLVAAGLFFSYTSFAAGPSSVPLITISKIQYGEHWAFTKEEVQLRCTKDNALYVINTGTLAQYPLNDIAMAKMKAGQVQGQSLDIILLNDPKNPEKKMSLQPFIERAQALCQ